MLEKLISIIAPHRCLVCEREGELVCNACRYELIEDANVSCVLCGTPTLSISLCNSCNKSSGVDALWAASEYDGVIKKLIYAYKFERAKDAYKTIASLLDEVVPQLFTTAIVVNIPSASSRVRQRGYDHTALIAKEFAHRRTLSYHQILRRTNNFRQLGASRNERIKQAKDAFTVSRPIKEGTSILLIDDVVTTGATVTSAAKALKKAGAKQVFVATSAFERLQW